MGNITWNQMKMEKEREKYRYKPRRKMKLKNNRSNPINLSSKSVRYNKKNNDIYTNILSEIDRKTNYYHSQKRKMEKNQKKPKKPDIDNIDNIIYGVNNRKKMRNNKKRIGTTSKISKRSKVSKKRSISLVSPGKSAKNLKR